MEERIKFDNDILKFFYKHRVFFLLLIPILLSIFLRIQPVNMPITDTWAEQTIYSNLRGQITQQLQQQNPNLPQGALNQQVEIEFQKILKEQKVQIEAQVLQTSQYFKSRMQDETGQTYLLAIDPWVYMKTTENVLEFGQMGNTVKDGKNWDSFIMSPMGIEVADSSLHVSVEYYLFKFVKFFKRDVSLMAVIFYLLVILITLALIPVFFIARRKGGNLAGFVAAYVVGVSAALLSRTPAGFADTDSYSILFPLFIAWFFLIAFDAEQIWKKYLYISLSALTIGIYSAAWPGWFFIFDFILVVFFAYIIYLFYESYRGIKTDKFDIISNSVLLHTMIMFVVFIIVTTICVNFVFFENGMQHALWGGPTGFIKLKEIGINTIWPNVYTTVAEQNPSTLKATIFQIGGKFLVILSLVGIILMFFRRDKDELFDIKYCILMSVWFAATIFASVRGLRYILLLVPAFAIALGVALGIFNDYIMKYVKTKTVKTKMIQVVVILGLLSLLFVPRNLLAESYNTALSEVPSINDAWYQSLERLKYESSEDAILTSWWDMGFWFKAVANRGTTFDGGSQNTPMAHWVGRLLLTDNVNESLGILRMLDCGSYQGQRVLEKYLDNNTLKSITVTKQIILLNRDQAKSTLLNYINTTQAEEVLNFTHCTPPEAYLIVSTDMVGKSGVWAHFGSWDFKRATIYNRVVNQKMDKSIKYLMSEFNYTGEEAAKLFYEVNSPQTDPNFWISSWPSYQAGSPELINSTFTKLFFEDGENLTYFEKFSDMTSFNGQRIIIWKVKWEAFINDQNTIG